MFSGLMRLKKKKTHTNTRVYIIFKVRFLNGQQNQSICSNQRNVEVDVSIHIFYALSTCAKHFGSVQISNHITLLSRYLKSKELWREDPAPGWVIHQVQNAVNPR